MININIKKLTEDAVIPEYAHPTDAGMDLTAISREFDHKSGCVKYGTGIAVEIPEGFVGLLFPRSSIYKHYMSQTNCVGVIDSGYRGEVKVIMRPSTRMVRPLRLWDRLRAIFCRQVFKDIKANNPVIVDSCSGNTEYKVGERIAQLIIMPYPKVAFHEVEELSDSDRGTNGHGSTGR